MEKGVCVPRNAVIFIIILLVLHCNSTSLLYITTTVPANKRTHSQCHAEVYGCPGQCLDFDTPHTCFSTPILWLDVQYRYGSQVDAHFCRSITLPSARHCLQPTSDYDMVFKLVSPRTSTSWGLDHLGKRGGHEKKCLKQLMAGLILLGEGEGPDTHSPGDYHSPRPGLFITLTFQNAIKRPI